jgi:hypothetical protein
MVGVTQARNRRLGRRRLRAGALALVVALLAAGSVFAVAAFADDTTTTADTTATADPSAASTTPTDTTTTPTDTTTTPAPTDTGSGDSTTGDTSGGTTTTPVPTGTTTTPATSPDCSTFTSATPPPAPTDSTTTTDPSATTTTTPAPTPTDPTTGTTACPTVTDTTTTGSTTVSLVDPDTGMLCLDQSCLTANAKLTQLIQVALPTKLIVCNKSSGNLNRPGCQHNPSSPNFFQDAHKACANDLQSNDCQQSLASCQKLVNKGHFSGAPQNDRRVKQFTQKRIEGCKQLLGAAHVRQQQLARIASLLALRAQLRARLAALALARRNGHVLTSCMALSSFGRLKNVPADVILLKLRCPGEIDAVSVKYTAPSGNEGKVKSGAARVGTGGKPMSGKVRKSGKIAFPKVKDTSGDDVGFRLMLDPAPATGATFHLKVFSGPGSPETVDLTL